MPGNTVQITFSIKEDGLIVIDNIKGKISDLTKETSDLGQQTAKTGSIFDSIKGTWVELVAKVGLATAAFYMAKNTIYDTAKNIAAQSMAIETQARMLGMSTTELQKWQYVAKMSSVDAESFSSGIRWLSRNMDEMSMGLGGSIKYFKAIGVSVTDASGNLKSFDTIMAEIADKFASWEDGPRKIAIALGLFGRGGEAMVPMLNKGSAGIHGLMDEAVKLGTVLGDVTVKKGSQAEDTFKRIEASTNAARLSLAPAALAIADAIMAVVNAIDELKKRASGGPFFPLAPGGEVGGTGWVFRKGAYEGLTLKSPEVGYGISGQKLTDLWENFPGEWKPPAPSARPEEQILKYKQALADVTLQYAILIGNVSLQEKAQDQINALKIKEISLNEQLTGQEKGALIAAVQKVTPEEKKVRELGRAAPVAEAAVQEAQQLGNINLIQDAEKSVFEIKMKQLATTKDFSPELEKQLRKTFDIEQLEKRRAAEAEYYKYPQYEAMPDDWEKAGKKAAEERRKAVIDLAQQSAQLTGDLEGQMQASRDLDALEIARINREQGGDENLIKLTKDLGELKRQQIALDYQKNAIDIKSQTANLAGDWDKVKSAESEALEVERQSLLLKYSANKAMQDQVNLLYNMKQAEVEAQRTMDIPALMDIGARKAAIQANQDLANQYENLIPNAISTMTDAIKSSDGSFKNFFDNASKGFAKMALDIASGILKKEILNVLVTLLPEPLKKLVQPEQKVVSIKPEGDSLPVKITNWPGLTEQGVPLKAPEAVSAAQGTVGGTESAIAGAEAAVVNTTNVAEKVGGATGIGEITQATSILRSVASMIKSIPKLINDLSKGWSNLTSTIPGITETSLPLLSVVGEGGGGLEGLGSIMGEFFKYGGTVSNIRAFQGGGVVNQPTVAIFGEGTQSEAFIPLNQGKIPLEMSTIRSFQDRANLEAFVPLGSGKLPVETKNMQSTWEKLIATETTRIQSATKNIQGFQEGSAVGSARRSEVSHAPALFFRGGGIIENIRAFQEGGVVSEPTLALFGEGNQDEAFVPLRGGKIPVEGAGGTNSYTIYHTSIYANDAASFEDMVNRNPGAILKVIHKDSKFNRSGIMRNIVKRG